MDPVRQFPGRVPNVNVGSFDFESGYYLHRVEGISEDSQLICQVCNKVAKEPIEMESCGHLFCMACIKTVLAVSNHNSKNPHWTQRANCPICRHSFTVMDYHMIADRPSTIARLYNSLSVTCSMECGFKASPNKINKHEVFDCTIRPIRCPNYQCPVVRSADKLMTNHFPSCNLYRVYCPQCNLAVRQNMLKKHDCIAHLKDALKNFYQFFNSHCKIIPPLSRFGPGGEPLYDIQIENHLKYLDQYANEENLSDMSEDEFETPPPLNIQLDRT